MKAAFPNIARIAGLVLGGLIFNFLGLAGCSQKPPPPAPAAKAKAATPTNAVAAATAGTNGSDQYVSVFEDLPAPQGRDPFFPASPRRVPVAAVATPDPAVQVDAALVLKGITYNGARSQAVVGSTIFEKGEEESVRVPYGGKVRVRCLDIGPDYVLVQVAGEGGPKRLMMEQKK